MDVCESVEGLGIAGDTMAGVRAGMAGRLMAGVPAGGGSVQPRKAYLAIACSYMRVERATRRDGKAGKQPVMVTVLLVVLTTSCRRSTHL